MKRVRGLTARCGGFTYLLMLVLVFLLGLALMAVSTVWSIASQRDKEAELLFVGREFREALQAYNRANPTVGDGFPMKLEDLLLDAKAPYVRRFLRKVYVDPMTGKAEWGLVRTPAGSIRGVYSLSALKPIRTSLPEDVSVGSGSAASYADWKFAVQAVPATVAGGATATPSARGSAPDVVAVVGGPPSAIPAPPTPEQREARRCQLIVRIDQGACEALERRYGQRASGPCFLSAAERSAACQSGTPVPPLATNER